MHYILRQGRKALFFTCFYMLIIFNPIATEASLIDDVTIDTIVGGYEVKINFEFLIRYQRHKPDKTSDIFRIELVPVNLNRLDVMTIASLKVRRELSWDRGTGIPLKDITYEGGDPKHPQMTFIFTREVELDVRGSADLRSLIISVKTNMATQTDGVEEAITEVNKVKLDEEIIGESSVIEKDIEVIVSDKIDVILEKDDDNLMEMAKMAMTEANYRRAVQLYTKILRTAEGEEKKQAQEFIGLARERNDQFAHAKSEYKKYLKDYPEGPDAVRVRQRLAGLVTAAKKPKKRIVEVNKPKKIDEKPKWRMRNYGSYSNFFYRNQYCKRGEKLGSTVMIYILISILIVDGSARIMIYDLNIQQDIKVFFCLIRKTIAE